jgi:lysine-arginine-ornithine-binding protein
MIRWLALAAAGSIALAGAANAQDTIRIGTEGAYPPYNFTDASGELVGFEIDMARELCERMDAECTFVAQDWDGIIPALINGRYDVIIAGMSITDERRERIAFTQGYVTTPAQFFTAADGPYAGLETIEETIDALSGAVLGVQGGTIHQVFAESEIPDADLRTYGTQEQLNLDLMAGRVDVGLADTTSLDPFLDSEEGQGFTVTGPGLTGDDFPVFGEGVGVGARQGDEELIARFDAAICEMKEVGSLRELAIEWFGLDTTLAPGPMCD